MRRIRERISNGASVFTLSRYAGRGQGEGPLQAPRRALTRRPSPLPSTSHEYMGTPEYRERVKSVARLIVFALIAFSTQSYALAHAGHPHDDDGPASAG